MRFKFNREFFPKKGSWIFYSMLVDCARKTVVLVDQVPPFPINFSRVWYTKTRSWAWPKKRDENLLPKTRPRLLLAMCQALEAPRKSPSFWVRRNENLSFWSNRHSKRKFTGNRLDLRFKKWMQAALDMSNFNFIFLPQLSADNQNF